MKKFIYPLIISLLFSFIAPFHALSAPKAQGNNPQKTQNKLKGQPEKYVKRTIIVLETGSSIIDAHFYQMLKDLGRFHYETLPGYKLGAGGMSNLIDASKKFVGVNKKEIYNRMRETEQKYKNEAKAAGMQIPAPKTKSANHLKTRDVRVEDLQKIKDLAFLIRPEFSISRPRAISELKVEADENYLRATLSATIPVIAKIDIVSLKPDSKETEVRSMFYQQDVSLNLSPRFDKSSSQIYLNYLRGIRNQMLQGKADFLYPDAKSQQKLLTLKSPTLMGEEIKKALIINRDKKVTQSWHKYLKSIKNTKKVDPEKFITDYLPWNISAGLTKALFDGYDLSHPDIAEILVAAGKEAGRLPLIGGLLGSNLTLREAQLLYQAKRDIDLKGAKSAAGVFLDAMNSTDLWSIGMFRWMLRDIQSIEEFKLAAPIKETKDVNKLSFEMGMEYGVDRDTWFKTVEINQKTRQYDALGWYKTRSIAYKSSVAQTIWQTEPPETSASILEAPTIAYNLTGGTFLPFHFNDSKFEPGLGAYLQGAFDLSRTFDRMAGRRLDGWIADFINEFYTTQTLSYSFSGNSTYPYQLQFQLGLLKKHYLGSLMPYYGLSLGGNIRNNRQKQETDEGDHGLSHYYLGLEAGLGWMFWYEPFVFLNLGVSTGINIATEKEYQTYFSVTPRLNLGWEF